MGCPAGIGNLFRLVILGLTALSLVMQIMTTLSCDMVELKNTDATFGVFIRGTDTNGCNSDVYDTEDPYIMSARAMLIISILAGALAGFMVLVELVCLEICCAACLEMSLFFMASGLSGLTFLFYGSEVCTIDDREILQEYGLDKVYDFYVNEGGEDFISKANADEPFTCNPSQSSHFMTVAVISYFLCTILLCCTPSPAPLLKSK